MAEMPSRSAISAPRYHPESPFPTKPASIAWRAIILTVGLQTQFWLLFVLNIIFQLNQTYNLYFILYSNLYGHIKSQLLVDSSIWTYWVSLRILQLHVIFRIYMNAQTQATTSRCLVSRKLCKQDPSPQKDWVCNSSAFLYYRFWSILVTIFLVQATITKHRICKFSYRSTPSNGYCLKLK